MNHCLASLLFVVLSSVALASAGPISSRSELESRLGANLRIEQFEDYAIAPETGELLFSSTLDSNSVVNGQGPNLVLPGARYRDPTNFTLQWNGDQFHGMETKSLLAVAITGGIQIEYTELVQAMGVDLRSYEGQRYDGAAEFYDTNGRLLGSLPFALTSGGAESIFIGWDNPDGLGRVIIHSPDHPQSPAIDNHGYGAYEGTPLTLDVSGQCPGRVIVEWNHARPHATLGLVFAFDPGSIFIPSGPCMGTPLGLGTRGLQLVHTFNSGDGSGSVGGNTGSQCQHYLQLVEVPSCATSNVAQIP